MCSLKTGSCKVCFPSLINLQLCAVVFILITTQLQTEHVLAFGFLRQPTRRFNQSRRFTPLFAKSYDRAGTQGRARKANNHRPRTSSGPPNAVNTQELVQRIRSSRNCFELGKVLRENPNLFYSEDSIRALIPKVAELKPESARDVAGLLNALAKARVPPHSRQVHTKLMLALGELAGRKIEDFDARGIAMTLNAFAKRGLRSPQFFEMAAEAAIPIIGNFNSQGLANTVNAFAKMNHHHPMLFDEVANAAIPIIGTFKSQELANTVNAFAKMDHHHPMLFDEVAKAAIPIIDTFDSQQLANTVNAFAKMDHHHPMLFDEVASAAIPIIGAFNAQDVANTVNAFAKMDHHHPVLFDEVANAAISIIGTFNSQGLANTVNAFAKMDHHHPMLFEEVANAAIPIIGTFNSQELANTVNAFAKMDHHHPMLFDEVAKAAIPIIDTFNSQSLANLVSAIARTRQDSESCRAVYSTIADTIKANHHCLNEASDIELSAIAYAFLKGGHVDDDLLELIGIEVSCRGAELSLGKPSWGHLAAAFSKYKSPVADKVFDLLFRSFLEQVDRSDERLLESIADVYNAVLVGEHFNDVPSDFLTKLTELAMEYSSQARMEDVRDILFGATRVEMRGDPLQRDLYTTYRPLFERYRKDMSPRVRDSINETFEYLGLR
eukprot:scaffold1381_cov64-Cylindrotheca_fusiformis.AAC.11